MGRFRLAIRSLSKRFSGLPENAPAQDYRFFVFASYFYLFSIVTHALFIPFFGLLGARTLAIYNGVSTLIYGLALHANLNGRLRVGLWLMAVEVLGHTVLCAHSLGNTVFIHVPMILALLIYLAAFERPWAKLLLAGSTALVYGACNYYVLTHPAAVPLSLTTLSALNIVIGSGSVLAACYIGHYYSRAAAHAELVLQQRTLELQARNEELDAFSHTVAHDLRGPLSSITAYSELLETYGDGMPATELREHLSTICTSARKMGRVINDILLLASVRRAGEVEMGPLAMDKIVAEAMKRLSYQIAEAQAQISLPGAWPGALGYGPWVEEVWLNYISNALRYGGRPPQIELGAHEEPGGTVRFWVRDNGPGISPEAQARLFAPYHRAEPGSAAGHGLGLSIVLRIVEKMGGQVGVESRPGEGSTFFFTLPQKSAREKRR